MKKDISTTVDIEMLVNKFYAKVLTDETISSFFITAVNFSFEKHIPIMISFWETLLFGVMSYKGNPMIKHIDLNKTQQMLPHHFAQWLALWEQTVTENFEGNNAKEAVSKAKNIAAIMQLKVNQSTIITPKFSCPFS
jgi:hemoglobin